jgi:thioredoxin 1
MPQPQPINQYGFYHQLASVNGAALILFTAPACAACRRLRLIITDPLFDDLACFSVDAVEEAGLVAEFEVFHLPAIFLWHNGDYHAAIHAELTPHALRTAIDDALQRPPEPPP